MPDPDIKYTLPDPDITYTLLKKNNHVQSLYKQNCLPVSKVMGPWVVRRTVFSNTETTYFIKHEIQSTAIIAYFQSDLHILTMCSHSDLDPKKIREMRT